MFTFGEQWGDGMVGKLKVRVQNGVYGTSKAPKPGCAGSLMAEMKQSLHCGGLDC